MHYFRIKYPNKPMLMYIFTSKKEADAMRAVRLAKLDFQELSLVTSIAKGNALIVSLHESAGGA